MIHGGNIYNKKVDIDFSVNVAPFEPPKELYESIKKSLDYIGCYPEYEHDGLANEIAVLEGCSAENIVCTAGASEAFLAAANAVRPRRALLCAPGFFGYEHSLVAVGCDIEYYELKEELGFALDEQVLYKMTEDIDMMYIASPNNPSGRLIDDALLERIIRRCCALNIYIVMDECFGALSEKRKSGAVSYLYEYPNVIIVKSFTKVFAIPGIRVGYAICDVDVSKRIRAQLPEWNISVVADAAGKRCANILADENYSSACISKIKEQRAYLKDKLSRFFVVYDSDTCFLLLKLREEYVRHLTFDLYEALLKKGILIRDCKSFRGLNGMFYRVAVRDYEDNKRLIVAIEDLLNE